jgi:hypothetical protein
MLDNNSTPAVVGFGDSIDEILFTVYSPRFSLQLPAKENDRSQESGRRINAHKM